MSVIHSLDKHIEGSQKHNNEQKKLEQKLYKILYNSIYIKVKKKQN